MGLSARVTEFLRLFEERTPIYFGEIERTMRSDPELFGELADPMLRWAEAQLGPDYASVLIDGYAEFLFDVNRAQLFYEENRRYENRSYEDVYRRTYGSAEFMHLYHWGVYVSTFVWKHHVALWRFCRDAFLSRIPDGAFDLIDLGSGSGIWHLLAMMHRPRLEVVAVDISETSIALAKKTAERSGFASRIHHHQADALTFAPTKPMKAGVSCFLLEHLETPEQLLSNLARALEPHAYAFVTCAVTAAEIDHIFEMVRESEPVLMAERAGFRLVELLSSSPDTVPPGRRYLPRSLGMVLQKRTNEIW